jgi:protein-S-isoprenylcysteine O-methyltransferase Ste14
VSLIPAFEIGAWNAWILILFFYLIAFGLTSLIERVRFKYKADSRPPRPIYNEQDKKITLILMVTVFASFIYSVFLPLKLGTAWFYAGLIVYLLGMVFLITAEVNFVSTPVDKLVTKGVYRISRNPMWFGFFLIFIGIGIACASWVYLLSAMIFIILQHVLLTCEERWCLEKYGDAYSEYMKKTPKYLGIPKSEGKAH